ncbi:MAG: competence/damage-inducible protein A, partial [Aeromonas sobria]
GDTEPAQQILALLQGRPLTLLEGESGGALLALCHGYPRLEARFSAQLADELAQLPTADAGLQLTIGREGSEGVPLQLSADGKQIGQTVKVSHPDPESRRKILAFAALDMLRRHLLGEPILGDYLTLARTAQRG